MTAMEQLTQCLDLVVTSQQSSQYADHKPDLGTLIKSCGPCPLPNNENQGMSTNSTFQSYLVNCSPNGCLDVVLSCANDGEDHWRPLFKDGFADHIAENPRLKTRFFKCLCIDDIQPHAHKILRAFLATISRKNSQCFLSSSSLADKTHPANHVFSRAAYPTPTGRLAMDLLQILIEAGLKGDLLKELALRRHLDVKAACGHGNQGFLGLLFKDLLPIPRKLLVHIVSNAKHGPSVVAKLIEEGIVSLDAFCEPEVMNHADESVRSLIWALEARAGRGSNRSG